MQYDEISWYFRWRSLICIIFQSVDYLPVLIFPKLCLYLHKNSCPWTLILIGLHWLSEHVGYRCNTSPIDVGLCPPCYCPPPPLLHFHVHPVTNPPPPPLHCSVPLLRWCPRCYIEKSMDLQYNDTCNFEEMGYNDTVFLKYKCCYTRNSFYLMRRNILSPCYQDAAPPPTPPPATAISSLLSWGNHVLWNLESMKFQINDIDLFSVDKCMIL